MAIKLIANYSKKLGLPKFSSHSFSVSLEVELTDINQAETEVQKLYGLLQQSVDQEIQHPGFVPSSSNGHGTNGSENNNNNNGNEHALSNANGRTYQINGNANDQSNNNGHPSKSNGLDRWNCTDGQRGLILQLISDNKLEKRYVEDLSQQFFGIGVKLINKMQASQLIEELLGKSGKTTRKTRWQPQTTR